MSAHFTFMMPDSEALRLAEICRTFGDDSPEVIADAVRLHLDEAETDVCAPAPGSLYRTGTRFSLTLPDSEAAVLEALSFRVGYSPPHVIGDAVRLHLNVLCETARKQLAAQRIRATYGDCQAPPNL